jgi:hypothetical protein
MNNNNESGDELDEMVGPEVGSVTFFLLSFFIFYVFMFLFLFYFFVN